MCSMKCHSKIFFLLSSRLGVVERKKRVFLIRIINYVPFTTRCSLHMVEIIIKIKPIYITSIILLSSCERKTHKCADTELFYISSRVKFHCSTVKFFISPYNNIYIERGTREKSSLFITTTACLNDFFLLKQLSTPDLEHFL